MSDAEGEALKTPLHDLHVALGGRMVPFAGYALPVQYPAGILKEHLHTRTQAGLFDVSHMGQLRLHGAGAAAALETLVPGDLQGLGAGRIRYTLFLNERGGILDDLMVTRADDHLFVVVNAACKHADIAHLRSHLGHRVEIEVLEDRALLALQGPAAAAVLARFVPAAATMPFMSATRAEIRGMPVWFSRSGYTGEDGYELSVAADQAEALARLLLAEPEVAPIGLGARDSLRLEAGLCLYGHDLDPTTTPVEAALPWTLGRRRRGEANFPGAAVILKQLTEGVNRLRVGIRPDGKAPAREQTEITDRTGETIGTVTSGGFGPTVGGPVAMGYVAASHAGTVTPLQLLIRGKPQPGRIVPLPFVRTNYYRG